MRRFLLTVALVLTIVVGGWTLYHKDKIHGPGDFFRLAAQQFQSWNVITGKLANWQVAEQQVIRIAAFNLHPADQPAAVNPRLTHTLAEVIRQFDVVAVQGPAAAGAYDLHNLVDSVNQTGRRYRCAPLGARGTSAAPAAISFIYDADTIELEASRCYTVRDPDGLMRQKPLVAWFRTRPADPQQAFTFNLINLHINPLAPEQEIQHLNQLFRSVRNDGRGEDDVIMVGHFNADDSYLREMSFRHGLDFLIAGTPTDTAQSRQLANLLIDPLATDEFTGQAGVFDFMKRFNLSLEEALQISRHLPVWAEFAFVERGPQGRTASRPKDSR